VISADMAAGCCADARTVATRAFLTLSLKLSRKRPYEDTPIVGALRRNTPPISDRVERLQLQIIATPSSSRSSIHTPAVRSNKSRTTTPSRLQQSYGGGGGGEEPAGIGVRVIGARAEAKQV
jgi:hypothetical protein